MTPARLPSGYYLDAAATGPVRREAIEAMFPYLTADFGNPSSRHELGQHAARALSAARETVAEICQVTPTEVVFTSGGTEADNLAVQGIALARRDRAPERNQVLLGALEHPAVRQSAEYLKRRHGFEVRTLPVDAEGFLAAETLAAELSCRTALVSISYSDHEVGAVQDLGALADCVAAAGSALHSDAVQAAGWLPCALRNPSGSRIAALSLSGHKIGAPKGIGALLLAADVPAEPLFHGGGQQDGLRPGTENVAFAVGFATALQLAEAERSEQAARISRLRDTFITDVLNLIPEAVLTGPALGKPRHPGIVSFCFPGTFGESVLLELERRGVFCSSGAACSTGSSEPSAALLALGLDADLAQTAVRFSLPSAVTAEELRHAAAALREAVTELKALAPHGSRAREHRSA